VISKSEKFTSSKTRNALREKHSIEEWCTLIWFPLAIPKQAFISKLAMKDALATGDELLKWGYKGDVQCAFCRSGIEERDHLFFSCGYSNRVVWKHVMEMCNMVDPPIKIAVVQSSLR
jgi:hypothetical protein